MISHYQRKILDRMKAGERLCKRHTDEGDYYCFVGGDNVRAASVKHLFNSGIIRGADDGLFGDTQTYEVNFIPED